MPSPKRPHHRRVLKLLDALSSELLSQTSCYFGGGTRIVMELDEYRESRDVDFLCADQDGYRMLRNQITSSSLGGLFVEEPILIRDVRADMYGIRTFIEIDSEPVKFEIIREARISLSGTNVPTLPVPCLDHPTSVAEKLLANADRGLDKSTRSRDLIDLAFMAGNWEDKVLVQGLELAETAYGESVANSLSSTLAHFDDPIYRKQCIDELGVKKNKLLNTGLQRLRGLASS